jgi:hypothetical protein
VSSESGQTCSFTVTVIDNELPVINTESNPIVLWPPNHKYELITIANYISSITDNCGNIPVGNVIISKVTSDEPENASGEGDGNTLQDMVISGDCKSVNLRRERQGGGNGRVYIIHLSVTDLNGNIGTASLKVHIPSSQGNNNSVVDNGPAYTVNNNCNSNIQNVSGKIRDLQATDKESTIKAYNYPNPFSGLTTIRYTLTNDTHVRLIVYNQFGQKVAELMNGKKLAGTHQTTFDGSKQASGIYIYCLQTLDMDGKPVVQNGKMIVER